MIEHISHIASHLIVKKLSPETERGKEKGEFDCYREYKMLLKDYRKLVIEYETFSSIDYLKGEDSENEEKEEKVSEYIKCLSKGKKENSSKEPYEEV
jgi:hypothetical protein